MKLNEILFEKYKLHEVDEKLPDGVLSRATYLICNVGRKNANDRVYERDVWDRVLENTDLKEKIDNRALFGHAEHPEQTQSNLEKTSHVIHKMWISEDGNSVYQTMDFLDTPSGRIVDCLLRAGCGVGVSTRAEGDLEEAEDDEGNTYHKVISDSYNYVTTDTTADPSTANALPHDVKRNIVTEVKKLFENKDADEGEKEFGVCVLESMSCKDKSKCQKCGTCQVLEEKKLSAKAEDELPKSAIHQCNICGDKFDDPADVNTSSLCKRCAKSVGEKKIKETMRWVYGTRDEKWHEVGPEDRDFEHGLSQEEFSTLSAGDAKEKYLSPRRVGEKKTVSSLIKEDAIKVGDPVLLQFAQDDIKEAKVEKIEEGAVSLLIGTENPTAVNVDGDAAISVSPEGLITILPTEALTELGQKEPKVAEVPEQAPEELSPSPDEGELDIGVEIPERKVMGPEDKIDVGDTIEIRDLADTETVVEASKVTEVGVMIGDVDTEFHKVKTESGGDKWYEAEGYALVKIGETKLEVGSTVKLTKEALETYRISHHTADKEDWVRNIKFDENEITEGKVTKIEETGITISLDDGTQVSIEDPSAVNITVTAPAPAEEIQPILPPEEEAEPVIEPLPDERDRFESKIDEVKFAAGNLLQDKDGKDWTVKEAGDGGLTITQPGEPGTEKSIAWADVDSYGFTKVSESQVDEDISRKEFLTRRIKNLKKEKDTFEKENQRKQDRYEKELKALAAEGSGLKKESIDGVRRWTVRFIDGEGHEDSFCLTAPSKQDAEEKALKYNPEIDIKSTVEVEETKVEEATSVERDGEWFVESPSGAVLGGPYKSKIIADKRKKDVEFYAASKESKVDEMAVAGAIYVDKETGDKVTIKHIGLDDRTGEAVVNVEAGDPGTMTTEYSGKEFLEKFKLLGPPGRFGTGRKRESKVDETADIKAMYKAADLPAPDGKGIHTKAFHELVIKVAKGYVKSGGTPKEALKKAYPTAMKQLGKEKAVKKPHQKESISTTAKEIKDLRVVEASTRAERDKAVELLEEITDGNTQLEEKVRKEKAFEIKVLVNKIEKTLEAKEQELSAVRTKLEEKAKLAADLTGQLGEQKNLVVKAQEQWEAVVLAATDRVNGMEETAAVAKDKHQKDLLEHKNGHQEAIRQLNETNEIKVEKVKEEVAEKVRKEVTKEFVKCFVGFKLSETNLVVDDNSQALLEKCKSLTEVEELLEEITDAGRRSALHSESITGIHVPKAKVDPELIEAERQVGNAYKGMNS